MFIFSQCLFLPRLRFFSRQGHRKLLPEAKPLLQRGRLLPSCFPDHQPSSHGLAGNIEGSDVRLLEARLLLVHAHDQEILPDAEGHMPLEEIAAAAEQLLLAETMPAAGPGVDQCFEFEVVHAVRLFGDIVTYVALRLRTP